MKKTLPVTLALRALHTGPESPDLAGLIIDGPGRQVAATDGVAIAFLPLPDGMTMKDTVLLPPTALEGKPFDLGSHRLPADLAKVDAPPKKDLEAMAGRPVYRIAFDAVRLAKIAAAFGTDEVTLEFPVQPATGLIRVISASHKDAVGYLATSASVGEEGLLDAAPASGIQTASGKPLVPPCGPPVIRASADRKTIEITWPGRPSPEQLAPIKDPAIGFRYSGRKGTKRGVPACTWYAPDNDFIRGKVAQLFHQSIEAAA